MTTSPKTAVMRPRIASGVTSWAIVVRHTALMLSAAPARASSIAARKRLGAAPAAAIAAPQISTIAIVIRPIQRACANQPLVEGGDRRAERDRGVEQAGTGRARVEDAAARGPTKSARGMPKVIAKRSMTKLPSSALLERT